MLTDSLSPLSSDPLSSPLMTATISRSSLSSILESSPLLSNVLALSELSGEFYFYEPHQRALNSGSGSPLAWETPPPNEADRLSFGELSSYSLELCRELGSSLSKVKPEEALALICERKLWDVVSLLYVPSYCTAGDYGGGVHYLSNARVLLEDHGGSPQCREIYGGYGSSGIVIDPRYLSEELLESLQSLEDYPLLSEDDCGALELELQSEAWESYLSRDFERALERRLSDLLSEEENGEERAEQAVESLSEDQLHALCHDAAESQNLYWESEHNSMYLDVVRIVENLPEDELYALLAS
jgi:hypothetical protein